MKKMLTFLFAVYTLPVFSQMFEIRANEENGNEIVVELRATSPSLIPGTGNFVTDIVFGLKWLQSAGSGLDLDFNSLTTDYFMTPSGLSKQSSGDYYFWAFGSFTPFNFPENWNLDQWVEIMRIKTNGQGNMLHTDFEICEPGFDPTTTPNFGVDLVDYAPAINGTAVNVVTIESCSQEVLQIDIDPITPFTYQAIESIRSAGTVSSNTVVTFKASYEIFLSSGFTIDLGSNFTAIIESCPPE